MKLKYYIYMLTISLLFTSCKDFLEGRSLDKAIPSKVSHYKELMMGEVYMKSYDYVGKYLNYMTDDIGEILAANLNSTDDRYLYIKQYYTFAKETQIDEFGKEDEDKSWASLYNMILNCNIIEYEVDKLDEDEKREKYTLIAEAQVIRAIAYWHLVNMYGEVYKDAESAKKAFGVPINSETGIKDKKYLRATLAENYALMEKDLLSSIENFNKGHDYNSKFRPTANVARLFLTKIYLNMKQWDNVVKYSDEFLANTKANILSIDVIKKFRVYGGDPSSLFENNEAVFFSFGEGLRSLGVGHFLFRNHSFCVSSELLELFGIEMAISNSAAFKTHFNSRKDVRVHKYMDLYSGTIKSSKNAKEYGDFVYRIEEIYYNKAEALIEKGDYVAAIDLVNEVREQRINDVDYKLKPANLAEAKQMFREDKRKEFCFEDHRWVDIRRWGMSITHLFTTLGAATNKYTIKAESPNWVLPLPLSVVKINHEIQMVEREDCLTGTVQ